MEKRTLVWGASEKKDRYSNKAVLSLLRNGFEVEAYGLKIGKIETVEIQTVVPEGPFHTVTLYINPQNQKPVMEQILKLNPKRIIFNPGTENPEFEEMAENQGVQVVEACTLVMLSTNQF